MDGNLLSNDGYGPAESRVDDQVKSKWIQAVFGKLARSDLNS
jgi:hypothetical protein